MEPTSRPPRYVTLRDYLRVLRRYAIPIILIAAVGAGVGLADAKRQSPVYEATASVSFQDPAQDVTLVGLQSGLVQTPLELASTNAETLTRPEIMSRVRRNLRTHASIRSLASQVSGTTTTAGLLEINAQASNAVFAARLANSVAAIVIAQANRSAQASFSRAADDIRHEISTVQSRSTGSTGGANTTQLPVLEEELARLETLSHFAKSADLAQPAQTPTSASSPKTLRSAIIGLILGLVLAILLAFVRDSMDRRLRTPDDIESSFRFPILGHVRKRAMGRVVRQDATSAGSADLRSDLEAFRILRRNIEFLNLDSPPRAIVVTSGVPEEGKTTVAASLAFATAAAGKRTLLIDCDLRRPDLAKRLEISGKPGLSDYLTGETPSTEITHRIQIAEPPTPNGTGPSTSAAADQLSLTVIPAGSPTSHAAELLGSRRFRQLLDQAVSTYDMVIMDSSPLLPVADTLEMLPAVQAVVLCAREAKTKRDEAEAAKRALERFPDLPIGVVITGITPGRGDYELYAYSYNYS